jgi:sugar phosphate isomerase/epimerase
MPQDLPVVGVASEIARLPLYAEWLIASQRPLELQDPFFDLARFDTGAAALVRQTKSHLDGYAGTLGIHGPFVSLPLNAGDVRIRQAVSDRFMQALEFGAELEARYMVVHSPFTIFGHPLVEHTRTRLLGHMIDAVHATLERPLALAQQIGCTLVIETIQDTNPVPLCALVSSFDAGVRLSIDVGHTLITEQFGGPVAHEWVDAAGPLLAHVHLQDGDGVVDRHWLPGQGRLNWWALFQALQRSPAEPDLIIEVHDGLAAFDWLAARGFVR